MVEAPPMEPMMPPQYAPMMPMMAPMPYAEPYPTDLLSQIKMRNRRFQQSCAMEGMAPMRGGPMGPPPPPMMMQPPQMIEQNLNMTRRATRPFIPQEDVSYFELQKQIQELETMPNAAIRPVRFNADEFLSIDQLPPPKKTPAKAEPEPERPKPAAIRQVGIADQIAIRSYVLGKSGAAGAQ